MPAVLFLASVSVAGAVFLLLELNGPFDGIIRVSTAALQFALENLNR